MEHPMYELWRAQSSYCNHSAWFKSQAEAPTPILSQGPPVSCS